MHSETPVSESLRRLSPPAVHSWNRTSFLSHVSNGISLFTAPPTGTTPTPALPEQITDYFVSLVVCVVVIVVLSAGFLLLFYRWMENRKNRKSDGRQVELPAAQQKNGAPGSTCDSTYETMTPAPTDQDHIYSTLTDMQYMSHVRFSQTDTISCKSVTSQ